MSDGPGVNRHYYDAEHGRFTISRVVGYFDVSTFDTDMPFGVWTYRVTQLNGGEYFAIPNVDVFNTVTKSVEGTCGIGSTVEEAIDKAIRLFMLEVGKQRENKPDKTLGESDFVWLNWQPYLQPPRPDIYDYFDKKDEDLV